MRRVVLKSPVLYVVNKVMWCGGVKSRDLLGFSRLEHRIIFCTQTIQKTPIGPSWFARCVTRREMTQEYGRGF